MYTTSSASPGIPPTSRLGRESIHYLFVIIILLMAGKSIAMPKGHARLGLHGGDRVGMLVDEPGPAISVNTFGGYGVVESISPVDGAHHGLYGSITGSFYWASWFSAALGFDGLMQFHPKDDFQNLEKDRSLIGLPYLYLRSGYPITPKLLLGGDLRVLIPGNEAPSLVWSGITVDVAPLLTISIADHHTLSFKTGFRLDRTENAAPDLAHVRPGDRMSVPYSSYHAVLAGALWIYEINALCVWAELSADFLIGSSESFATSPMRVSTGVRYHITPSIELNLLTTVSLSKRPELTPDTPLIPIEPRISLFAGITLNFGRPYRTAVSGDKTDGNDRIDNAPTGQQTSDASKHIAADNTAAAPTGGTVSSRVLDVEGLPVAGAKVTIIAGKVEKTTTTDRNGKFELAGIPAGDATLRIEMPFFEPRTKQIKVTDGSTWTEGLPPLMESEVGSQIRGLVRNLNGDPVAATITVSPSNNRISANADGEFQLDVEPGQYRVTIEARGYKSQNRNVTVGTNSVEILNVDLRTK